MEEGSGFGIFSRVGSLSTPPGSGSGFSLEEGSGSGFLLESWSPVSSTRIRIRFLVEEGSRSGLFSRVGSLSTPPGSGLGFSWRKDPNPVFYRRSDPGQLHLDLDQVSHLGRIRIRFLPEGRILVNSTWIWIRFLI